MSSYQIFSRVHSLGNSPQHLDFIAAVGFRRLTTPERDLKFVRVFTAKVLLKTNIKRLLELVSTGGAYFKELEYRPSSITVQQLDMVVQVGDAFREYHCLSFVQSLQFAENHHLHCPPRVVTLSSYNHINLMDVHSIPFDPNQVRWCPKGYYDEGKFNFAASATGRNFSARVWKSEGGGDQDRYSLISLKFSLVH